MYTTRTSAYHLWLPLPAGWDTATATATLARRGVRVSAADEFRIEGTSPVHAIRLSLSATRDRARLERGLAYVADTLRSAPTRSALV